jgi:hypothetical protein
MKLNPEPAKKNGEDRTNCATAEAGVPERYRPLKWNELVRHGDFTMDLCGGFEPWEGPTGFRADAFVKPIYRQDKSRLIGVRK